MRADAEAREQHCSCLSPLARKADLSLDVEQNRKLIRHIEIGGNKTLLYGGNVNIYHGSNSDYARLIEMLTAHSAAGTRVIPATGPDFGFVSSRCLAWTLTALASQSACRTHTRPSRCR